MVRNLALAAIAFSLPATVGMAISGSDYFYYPAGVAAGLWFAGMYVWFCE